MTSYLYLILSLSPKIKLPYYLFDFVLLFLLDLYTIKGNAHGTPCMFPFQYNQQWRHECTREGREDNLLWCATTSRYERDEKWGFCPDPSKNKI